MVRSFSYSLLITCVLLIFSCKSTFVSTEVKTQNLTVTDSLIPLDSQLVRLYLPYKNILEKDMGRVISISEKEMIKDKPESELTNLLADLLLAEGQMEAMRNHLEIKPVVSFFNYGGIRTSLPKGDITVGKIFEIMPFENEMVFIQLTGEQLQQFYNALAEKGGDGVGGVRFIIANNKAKDVIIDGEKLNPASKYWMVTNDYSANGGDDMTILAQHSELLTSGKKLRDVIISNFEVRQKNGAVLTGNLDGRITNE